MLDAGNEQIDTAFIACEESQQGASVPADLPWKGEAMTLVVELDDVTPVDLSTIRETVTAHAVANRVVLHLTRGDAELVLGFRGERGACYWRRGDHDLVSYGGDNTDVEVYGANEIPFPPGSEIDAAAVIDAADEFAATGARPTYVTWTSYHEAMQAAPEEPTITPEELRALLDEPDADQ